MKEPTERQRAQLEELLWLEPLDPRRRRALVEDPELAELLAELEEAAAAAAGPIERARERTIERDAAGIDDRLEAGALATLRSGLVEQHDPAVHEPRRAPTLWIVATALVAAAALVLVVRPWARERGAEPVWLGATPAGASATPFGKVDAIDAFRWSPAPPPGSVHTVRVWRSAVAEGTPDVESPPRTTPEWIPTADVLAELGPAFTWAVFERSPVTGTSRRLFEARVELRR